MGILRLTLAIAVVCAHVGASFAGLDFFNGGVMAVESFFVLSGFYMALVLRTKYVHDTRRFFEARFVRLFPTYWIVCAIALTIYIAVYLVTGKLRGFLEIISQTSFPPWLLLWAAISNISMIGADALTLYGLSTDQSTAGLLILPAIWSLSIELVFYALAPFVLKRNVSIIVLLFLGLFLLRALIWIGNEHQWTAWNYYFAPSSLNLFLIGSLSYVFYERLKQRPEFTRYGTVLGFILLLGIVALISFYAAIDVFRLQDSRFYAIFALSLPFIFEFTKNSRLDRLIGDYSYPLYLCHGVVITCWVPLAYVIDDRFKVYGIVTLSFVMSAAVLAADTWLTPRVVGAWKRFMRPRQTASG